MPREGGDGLAGLLDDEATVERARRRSPIVGVTQAFGRGVEVGFVLLVMDARQGPGSPPVAAHEWLPLRESITGDDDESRFCRQELGNLTWTARNAWDFEGRDEGMGRNLLWLARERYSDRRIVVWSHNFHIVEDARALDAHHPNDVSHAVRRCSDAGTAMESAAP